LQAMVVRKSRAQVWYHVAAIFVAGRLMTSCSTAWLASPGTQHSPIAAKTADAMPQANSPTGARRGRRGFMAGWSVAVLGSACWEKAWAFKPSDLGYSKDAPQMSMPAPKIAADPNKLEDAIYYISRVQEATVQQERLVSTGQFKDVQRNNIKMAINMMLDNYRLGDQIVTAAGFVEPKTKVMQASAAGNEAIDVLETAKEYFGKDLKVAALTDDQRKFIVTAMGATREKLNNFLVYLPKDSVQAARKRVESENAENLKEYVGSDGRILNPVELPWKS